MVCTCALAIDPASKSIVQHIQKPTSALVQISTFAVTFVFNLESENEDIVLEPCLNCKKEILYLCLFLIIHFPIHYNLA